MQAYTNAMQGIYEANQNDPDVIALYIDSMMQLSPWKVGRVSLAFCTLLPQLKN